MGLLSGYPFRVAVPLENLTDYEYATICSNSFRAFSALSILMGQDMKPDFVDGPRGVLHVVSLRRIELTGNQVADGLKVVADMLNAGEDPGKVVSEMLAFAEPRPSKLHLLRHLIPIERRKIIRTRIRESFRRRTVTGGR